MSIHDRDWYKDAMRERERAERTRQRPPVPDFPWRRALVTIVVFAVLSIVLDMRVMHAPLTAAGLRFWWSVKTAR